MDGTAKMQARRLAGEAMAASRRLTVALGARAGLGAPTPGGVRLHTLTLIRWVAVAGQLFTILLVHHWLGFALPIVPMLAAVALSAAINLGLTFCFKATTRLGERGTTLLFAYDVGQLGFLVALSGGLQNPFAFLLLVPVTLAATTLGPRATLGLCLMVIVGASLLALFPTPLPWSPSGLRLPGLYVFGMWTALVLATVLIAAYAWRMAEEARRMSNALTAAHLALAREQQLSALGGLAAAAAHQLGSPLATINVTAKELVRALPPDDPLAEDAAELLGQAQRCRAILATLSRQPPGDEHEPFTRAPLSALLAGLAEELRRPGVELQVAVVGTGAGAPREPRLSLTPELRHALANLIDNAVQFAASTVDIGVRVGAQSLEVVIEDDGPGFAPDVLEWLGEPYLSTRGEAGGLGLGIFIATTLLARTGVRVQFGNGPRGARVTLAWPRRALESPDGEEARHGTRDCRPASAGSF